MRTFAQRLARSALLGSLLIATPLPAGTTPGTFHAVVEEPVVPELMGGCSLRCGFPWRVFQLGKGFFDVKQVHVLNDEDPATAWVAEADAAGQRFIIKFPDRIHPDLEGTPMYGFDLINGLWRNESEWPSHERLKAIAVLHNGRSVGTFHFSDSRRWQRVLFPDIYIHSGDHLEIQVLETYPAPKPLALSEIVLQGAH